MYAFDSGMTGKD